MLDIIRLRTIFLLLLIPTFACATVNIKKDRKHESKQRFRSIWISGHYCNGTKHDDSIKITLWTDLNSAVSSGQKMPHRDFKAVIRNGNFGIQIDSIASVSYISLSDLTDQWGKGVYLLPLYVAEPGDNIHLSISRIIVQSPNISLTQSGDSTCVNCTNVIFTGRGAAKYNCRFKMDQAADNSFGIYNAKENEREVNTAKIYESKGLRPPVPTLKEESERTQKLVDYMEKIPLKILAFYKNRLNSEIYQVLKANLIGQIQARYYVKPLFIMVPYGPGLDAYRKFYDLHYYKNNFGITGATALKAVNYLDFLLAKSRLESALYNCSNAELTSKAFKSIELNKTYYLIKSKYTGLLRDKLLLSYFASNSSFLANSSTLIEDALHNMKTEKYIDLLNSMKLNSQVGTSAYNFSLPDSTDQKISLDRFKGKVVFIDFWFTGCNGCAQYYHHIVSKVEEDYRTNSDVIFISISLDANKSYWQEGVHSHLYTSESIINLYKATSSPIVAQFSVSACPHPLLIDKKGLIFSNSSAELQSNGVEGLENKINEALAIK